MSNLLFLSICPSLGLESDSAPCGRLTHFLGPRKRPTGTVGLALGEGLFRPLVRPGPAQAGDSPLAVLPLEGDLELAAAHLVYGRRAQRGCGAIAALLDRDQRVRGRDAGRLLLDERLAARRSEPPDQLLAVELADPAGVALVAGLDVVPCRLPGGLIASRVLAASGEDGRTRRGDQREANPGVPHGGRVNHPNELSSVRRHG